MTWTLVRSRCGCNPTFGCTFNRKIHSTHLATVLERFSGPRFRPFVFLEEPAGDILGMLLLEVALKREVTFETLVSSAGSDLRISTRTNVLEPYNLRGCE